MEEKQANPLREEGGVLDGRYRLEQQIGRGGMGAVFAAVDLQTGARVAVKKLHDKHLRNVEIRERFQREADIAHTLNHPGICPVLHAENAVDSIPYIVMPLLTGNSLAAIIHGADQLSIIDVVHIVCCVLDTLSFSHRHGVLHRDIKPSNVFVSDASSQIWDVKLLDFGISKFVGTGASANITTATGAVFGSPHYMAPEQARGAKHLDERADIYAVGVLLYEALTRRRPFEGSVYNDVIVKLVSEPFVPPSDHVPELSQPLEQVVLKAMARHPDDRYRTADEMRAALENVVASGAWGAVSPQEEVTTVHDGDKADRVAFRFNSPRTSRRHALQLAFVVVIVFALLAVSRIWPSTDITSTPEPGTSEHPAPKMEKIRSQMHAINSLSSVGESCSHHEADLRDSEPKSRPEGRAEPQGRSHRPTGGNVTPMHRPRNADASSAATQGPQRRIHQQKNLARSLPEPPASTEVDGARPSIDGRLETRIVSTF